jgi:AraC-like DNA-binding protein
VEVRLQNGIYHAKKGSLIFLNRFEEHAVCVQSNVYHRFVVNVRPKIDETGVEYKLFSILFNRPLGFCNILDACDYKQEFQDVFLRIVQETDRQDETGAELASLYAQELLLKLYRRFPKVFSLFSDGNGELVYKIQKQFEMNYANDFSLAKLAREYGLSESYLSHIFKEVTGSSVMGYLQTCRIAAAKKYLVKSEKRINEIIELCGFSDNSNFSRTFKRCTGETPLDFRKKYHEKTFITSD